jgi:hypothetical protein
MALGALTGMLVLGARGLVVQAPKRGAEKGGSSGAA